MLRKITDTVGNESLEFYSTFIDQVLEGSCETDPGFDKLALETCHVAKLLSRLDDRIQFINKTESPDFIIKVNDNIIGIEHEIIVDVSSKKIEGSLKNLIKVVESNYRLKYPERKLLANIYLNSNTSYKKVETENISNKIFEIIEEFIATDRLPENAYIDNISKMKHSRLDFVCNLGAWCQRSLTNETLLKAIAKKETKLSNYRKNSGTKTQWLLMVIGGIGESSYEIDSIEEFNLPLNSKFDKIFLLEDFSANIYEVK